MPINHGEKNRYRGPVASRSIDDLSDVEQAAFKMEARNAATSFANRYRDKPEFLLVIASYLRGLATEMVEDRDLTNNRKSKNT